MSSIRDNAPPSFAPLSTAALEAVCNSRLSVRRGAVRDGGHVGLATGETRMHNGRLQVKMLAGNDGDAVREHWIDADRNLMVRRGNAGLGINAPGGVTYRCCPRA